MSKDCRLESRSWKETTETGTGVHAQRRLSIVTDIEVKPGIDLIVRTVVSGDILKEEEEVGESGLSDKLSEGFI